MIEGTDIEHIDGQNVYRMNTEKVLFICLGAFDGLDEIIKNVRNQGKKSDSVQKQRRYPKMIFSSTQKKKI